jgi:hypothetical protein
MLDWTLISSDSHIVEPPMLPYATLPETLPTPPSEGFRGERLDDGSARTRHDGVGLAGQRSSNRVAQEFVSCPAGCGADFAGVNGAEVGNLGCDAGNVLRARNEELLRAAEPTGVADDQRISYLHEFRPRADDDLRADARDIAHGDQHARL